MKKIGFGLLILIILSSFGCASMTDDKVEGKISPVKITAEEAKKMMDDEEILVVDVRTKEEFQEGHVENAINIPLDVIGEEISTVLSSQEDPVLLYCRSGNRSGQAAKILVDLGYLKVYDFGGINDWPYDVVK